MSKCSECGVELIFAITPSNKTIPLDADPTDDRITHTYAIRPSASRDHDLAIPVKLAHPNEPVHKSHFLTCTAPNKFSRGGKR